MVSLASFSPPGPALNPVQVIGELGGCERLEGFAQRLAVGAAMGTAIGLLAFFALVLRRHLDMGTVLSARRCISGDTLIIRREER